MAPIEYTIESEVAPDRVMAAATDFTDRRPDLWPNISRRFWKVHGIGDGWCECTEGSDNLGGVWVRARYEWTDNRVAATVQDSNIFDSGTWELTVEPAGDGSRIHAKNEFRTKGKGVVIAPVLAFGGKRFFSGRLRQTLDILRSS